MLAMSLALHLATLIEALLGRAVDGGALFVTGQFFLSLALLRLYDGKWVIQDIRLFFAIFLFLYGATLPLVVMFGLAGDIPGIGGAAYMYGTAFVAFNLVQWWYRQPWHDIPPEVFRQIRPGVGNAIVLSLAFAFVIGYAVSRGVEIGLTIDRSQVRFLGTQLWVVSIFAVNGLAMFMFAGWSNLSRIAKIGLVLSVMMFVGFQLLMGNRRDFIPMFVFIACVVATRRHMVIRAGTLIIGSVAFVLFTAVGIIRQVLQDPSVLARFNPIELVVTQNEFVSPIYTLMHYVVNVRPLRWGFTYIAVPGQFIPRAIWPDKPESLSLQFMRDAFGSTGLMGYAYTPVTEAFLNFAWVGPFMVFAIWSILMVKLVRSADAHPGLYFICYALVVDFHRGEFAGTFYALCVVGSAYAVMLLVSRLRWAPRRVSAPRVSRPTPVLHS
jgi:oligosaccharide repeat unit polymerase